MSSTDPMPSRPPRPARRAGLLARFRRCRRGATAVEFGLISLPFFALMFAILETALAFWITQVLETAVANAARQIYTGQFQSDSTNQTLNATQLATKFKTAVCSNVTSLFDCTNLVTIDVRPVSSYGGAQSSAPITNGSYDTTGYGYQNAGANQITLVRAVMQYPSFTSFLGNTTGLSNGKRLIMATSVFRTEPYSQ